MRFENPKTALLLSPLPLLLVTHKAGLTVPSRLCRRLPPPASSLSSNLPIWPSPSSSAAIPSSPQGLPPPTPHQICATPHLRLQASLSSRARDSSCRHAPRAPPSRDSRAPLLILTTASPLSSTAATSAPSSLLRAPPRLATWRRAPPDLQPRRPSPSPDSRPRAYPLFDVLQSPPGQRDLPLLTSSANSSSIRLTIRSSAQPRASSTATPRLLRI